MPSDDTFPIDAVSRKYLAAAYLPGFDAEEVTEQVLKEMQEAGAPGADELLKTLTDNESPTECADTPPTECADAPAEKCTSLFSASVVCLNNSWLFKCEDFKSDTELLFKCEDFKSDTELFMHVLDFCTENLSGSIAITWRFNVSNSTKHHVNINLECGCTYEEMLELLKSHPNTSYIANKMFYEVNARNLKEFQEYTKNPDADIHTIRISTEVDNALNVAPDCGKIVAIVTDGTIRRVGLAFSKSGAHEWELLEELAIRRFNNNNCELLDTGSPYETVVTYLNDIHDGNTPCNAVTPYDYFPNSFMARELPKSLRTLLEDLKEDQVDDKMRDRIKHELRAAPIKFKPQI